jgi:minor extracellular serine protease Vpr
VLNGSWTAITPADLLLLAKGELYFNFHTAAFPNGEVRGQIVPTNPTLRLPVHASARPASDMSASLALGTTPAPTGTLTGTIALAGFGVNNTGLPTDALSIASVFELAASNPRLASTNVLTDYADLQYVGVNSDLEHTGVVSESILLFAVTTHDSWSSPNQTYFEIQFDTDEDGTPDYALFTTNSGVNEDNDDIYTSLAVLDDDGNATDFIDQYPINVFGSDQADTQPFNTNALVLAVDAGDLGLNDTSSDFNYQVLASTNVEDISVDDQTGVLHYNVARPGIRFGHGLFNMPFFNDLTGTSIGITYNPLDALGNGTQGVLVIHHHNTAGSHVEVLGPASVALPLIVDP